MMNNTTSEKPIETIFLEAWDEPFKCDICEFSEMYVKTRGLFCAREEQYRNILETIAQMANQNGGMCGRGYDALPEMLENLLDKSGDKARLKIEVSRLQKENANLALEIMRIRG